jgi:excisionase family DNA binding protein
MDTFYTVEQIAAQLQVTERTVREWLRTKRLRGVRAGRQWRIQERDLQAFLVRHEADSIPETSPPTPMEPRAQLISRVRAMYAEGLSMQAIANQLNDAGVPTISGKGRWQKGTVSNLLAEIERG